MLACAFGVAVSPQDGARDAAAAVVQHAAADAATQLLQWLQHYCVQHYCQLRDEGRMDHLQAVSDGDDHAHRVLRDFVRGVHSQYIAATEDVGTDALARRNAFPALQAQVMSPSMPPTAATPYRERMRAICNLLLAHHRTPFFPTDLPHQLQPSYVHMLQIIAANPAAEPLLRTAAGPIPRCTMHNMVSIARKRIGKIHEPTVAMSGLLLGGRLQGNVFGQFRAPLVLAAGHVHMQAPPAQVAHEVEAVAFSTLTVSTSEEPSSYTPPPAGSCGIWSRIHTHGCAPIMSSDFASAGLCAAAPSRFVLVFLSCIMRDNDIGIGASSWLTPPPGSAASALTMRADGQTSLVCEPLPTRMRPEHMTLLAQSRIFVLDAWSGTWHSVTPAWAQPWALYADMHLVIGADAGAPVVEAAFPDDAPCPRTGHTFTALRVTGDVFVDGLARADAEAFAASGAVCEYEHIVFGGFSQPTFMGVRSEDRHGRTLDDVYLLHTRVTRPTGACSVDMTFQWQRPVIRGLTPVPRLAHAACVLPMHTTSIMLVYGGNNHIQVLDDVCLLVRAPSRGEVRSTEFEWHHPLVYGAPPGGRLGHTCTSLYALHANSSAKDSTYDSTYDRFRDDVRRSSALVFGGRDRMHACCNSIHVVTCTAHAGSYLVTWSTPLLVPGPHQPSMRDCASAMYAPGWSTPATAIAMRDCRLASHAHASTTFRTIADAEEVSLQDQLRARAAAAFGTALPGAIIVFGGHEFRSRRRIAARHARDADAGIDAASVTDDSAAPPPNAVYAHEILQVAAEADAARDASAAQANATGVPPTARDVMDDDADEEGDACAAANVHALTLAFAPRSHVVAAHAAYSDMLRDMSAADVEHLNDVLLHSATARSVSGLGAIVESIKRLLSPSSSSARASGSPAAGGTNVRELLQSCADALVDSDPLPPDAHLELWATAARRVPFDVEAERARYTSLRQHALFITVGAQWHAPACRYTDAGPEPLPVVSTSTQAVDMASLVDSVTDASAHVDTDERAQVSPLAFSDFALRVHADEASEEEGAPFGISVRTVAPELLLRTFTWLLRARSPTFAAMLGRSELDDAMSPVYSEASAGAARLSGLPPAAAQALLFYLATDVLPADLPHDVLMTLLGAAGQYDLPRLATLAEARLIPLIDTDNVCGLLNFAWFYAGEEGTNASVSAASEDADVAPVRTKHALMTASAQPGAALRTACVSYVLRQFESVVAHDDFLELPPALRELLTTLWSDDSHVYSTRRITAIAAVLAEQPSAA